MKQNDFQDWLWSLNPKSPNFKTDLWETYKKGLVIYLMSMLKMSMDKIQEIQKENYVLKEIKALTAGIEQLESELSENQERNKEIRKDLKVMKANLSQVINQNPNQMKLAI
jgi:DNA gyrase/topoisomerase IV subunit A